MGDTVSKFHSLLQDQNDMTKNSDVHAIFVTEEDEVQDTIKDFEAKYPNLASEFIQIQEEQYQLFASKMLDYGLGNIALGGDLNNEDDQRYSLMGLQIRLNDKINRLKNLLVHKKNYVKGESIEDTFIDVANYGIIAMLVGRNQWK
jgi:hypothetical protein